MGEIEKTIERLNRVLAEAGFAKVQPHDILREAGGSWYQNVTLTLQYDKNGNFVVPESGEQLNAS
jgi:hypothetical protein